MTRAVKLLAHLPDGGSMTHITHSLKFGPALLILVLACVLAVLAAAPAPAEAGQRISLAEKREIQFINNYRAARGLPRLRLDARLTTAAEWMSVDLTRRISFSHTDSTGRSPFQRIAAAGYPSNTYRGENLAAGYASPLPTFRQWRGSASHNRNMLDKRYRAIGIARVYRSGSRMQWYWTTTFGSRVVAPL